MSDRIPADADTSPLAGAGLPSAVAHDCASHRGGGGGHAAALPAGPVGLPSLIGIGLIRLYRVTLSPLLGRQCRYLPTCSSYTEEAIRRHGLWIGFWMGLARIQRCGPFGASGFDPVPAAPKPGGRWYLPWRYGYWTGAHIDPATRLDR